MVIRPQAGPQEMFLSTSADVAIYGGAAGAGKSYALLMEPLRYWNNKRFGAVCFRRESNQVSAEGGLWDTSYELYSQFPAKDLKSPKLHWSFRDGMTVTFSHMQFEKNKRDWDGSQIALIMFDELQHFSATQFFYMLSRNRSSSGVAAYVRASCNPDPDSWLRYFLSWWIYQEEDLTEDTMHLAGFPIPERAGKVRWMLRIGNEICWADSREELQIVVDQKFPDDHYIVAKDRYDINPEHKHPKSVTFIPGKATDNKIMLQQNPEYLSNLSAMMDYEQKRLRDGNWFARPLAGEIFKRQYWEVIDVAPPRFRFKQIVRYWDRAGTLPSDVNPDPDYTAGALVGIDDDDRVYILDMVHGRWESGDVEKIIRQTAMLDGIEVPIMIEQDPGSAGKMEAEYYVRRLIGFSVEAKPKRSSKLTYWRPLAAQAKIGNVYLVRSEWTDNFIREASGVTDGTQSGHDDQVDAASGGFIMISSNINSGDAEVFSKIGGL